MAYDPNWLQKERAKLYARQERELSHIEDKTKPRYHYSTMLCGRGWGGRNAPSIRIVMFPSIDALPTCRSCREKFLGSIGVTDINLATGYPNNQQLKTA